MTREYNSVCAWCGYHHTCTSQVGTKSEFAKQSEEARLKPGDATMCIRCGEMNIVDHKGRLRLPTVSEAAELDDDVRVREMRRAIREVKVMQ